MELSLDSLTKVSGLSLVDRKNVFGRGDSTKVDKLGFPREISHRKNWCILRTNVMVIPKKES